MRRRGGGAPLERALTIENHNIERDGRRVQRRRGGYPGFFRNDCPEVYPRVFGQLKGVRDHVGLTDGGARWCHRDR